MVDAVTYKYLQAPLDADQLKKLVVAGTGPLSLELRGENWVTFSPRTLG